MNREILFRGKRIDNGEWITGSLLKVTFRGETYHLIFGDDFMLIGGDVKSLSHALVDPSTVGQYTGLTDKNGRKIFEGDILHFWSSYQEAYVQKCVVKYGNFNCTCCDGVYGWYLDGGDIRYLMDGEMWYEICGTIHDNPELLEEANG